MATVTMVFGEIGAGKTTYAQELESDGAVRLSLDEWTIAATGDPVHVDADLVQRMIGQLMSLWPKIAAGGVDVVLDFAFWDRSARDEVRRIAASIGADVRLVHVDCPAEVRRDRCLARGGPDGGYTIDPDTFDWITQHRTVDPLGADEPHETVNTDA